MLEARVQHVVREPRELAGQRVAALDLELAQEEGAQDDLCEQVVRVEWVRVRVTGSQTDDGGQ